MRYLNKKKPADFNHKNEIVLLIYISRSSSQSSAYSATTANINILIRTPYEFLETACPGIECGFLMRELRGESFNSPHLRSCALVSRRRSLIVVIINVVINQVFQTNQDLSDTIVDYVI